MTLSLHQSAGGAPAGTSRTASFRKRVGAYVLCGPFLLFLGVFSVLPAVSTLVLSLFDWSLVGGNARFTGLDSFRQVLGSEELRQALINTLLYSLFTVPAVTVLGLLIALTIHSVRRGKVFWRTVYFLPFASTLAAMSIVWKWMFYPERGLIDSTVGQLFGVTNWLSDSSLALPAVALVGVWHQLGYAVVLFLAGLGNVPTAQLEAARLDGANAWHRFWHVQWPALGPTTVFAVVISTISALRVYDTVALMTEGGPIGSTTTLSYELYRRGVFYQDISGGAVISIVLLVTVMLVTLVQMRSFGRRLSEAGAR
ncbi:carbohydrate ABC transporter permease [Streptomyces scopuliridis]|uniref:carbohydrate ABC transporter permease n=1 Tax=Streptomyces scopuliridis TaxID=452529 RepID=UPI0036B3C1E8